MSATQNVCHKAIVVAAEELVVASRAETVTLKTWGPMCDPAGWVPGTQLDRWDDAVTCPLCLEKMAEVL